MLCVDRFKPTSYMIADLSKSTIERRGRFAPPQVAY